MKIRIRKICKALEEDSFRPVLHHYDGPKFRLELSVPEVGFIFKTLLLPIFANMNICRSPLVVSCSLVFLKIYIKPPFRGLKCLFCVDVTLKSFWVNLLEVLVVNIK